MNCTRMSLSVTNLPRTREAAQSSRRRESIEAHPDWTEDNRLSKMIDAT
jgi:hypothetical protein